MNTETSSSTAARWKAPFVSLQHRDFLLLWVGQFISLLGSQMRIVAVNYQVYALTQASGQVDPALALGLLGLARVIPIVLTALLSGVVADSMDRRQLLLYASGAALLTSAVLAWSSAGGTVSITLIYVTIAVAALAGAFEMPARQALLPSLVPPEHLSNALSLNVLIWQLATVIGPSAAGVLLATYGVVPVYWIDTVSFLAVIGSLLLMRPSPVQITTTPPSLGAAIEGLRFVFQTPLIASTMLIDFFATFFGAALTLLPLFADQVLHVGPRGLGLLYAAPSTGAFVAAALLTTRTIKRQGVVMLWAVATFGLCTIVFGLSRSFPLTLLALAGTGAADTVSMVIRGTMRQLLTPNELRGRMISVNMIFFAGGPQLGEFEAGVLASLVGAPLSVAIGGALCIAMVGWSAWHWKSLRDYTMHT